jgi:hypothetical protein
MRITVTLDPDVVCLLKKEAHQRDQSLKITLNDAVRLAFQSRLSPPPKRKPFVVKARSMGLRPGIDPTRLDVDADFARFPKVRWFNPLTGKHRK